MTWPRDDAKLERVRALMADQDLDALVVRAPDNVLYLTNYWSMKGYDVVIFPREGEPTLIALEPQREDAERASWTSDIRLFTGYYERDPRPPTARSTELAQQVVAERGLEKIGLIWEVKKPPRHILENRVVFGSVNANRRHYETAAQALARADRAWLERVITRRLPLENFQEAYARSGDDVKTVLVFEN